MLDHINYKKITIAGALGILIAGFLPTEPGSSSSTLSDFPFFRASTNPTEFHTTTYNVDGQNLTGVNAFQQFSNTERNALDLDAVEARELDLTKLDLTYDYDVKVYFINEGAGYRNQLRLNSTGTTIVNGMVFNDVSCRSGTGCGLGSNIAASQALGLGDYVTIGNLSAGTSLDFEVVMNGYNNPNNYVWHIDKALNADNLQHVIAYEFEGYLVLAWEDLYGGGDRDYNDVIFAVDIGEYNLNKIPTVNNNPPTVDYANIDVQIDDNGPTSIDILNHASDPDGDSLSIIEVNGSSIGVNQSITLDDDDDGKGALLTLNDDGSFTYDPNDAFKYNTTNTDIFTYTIDDANGNQIEASVTVTVNMPEKPLKAKNDNKNANDLLQGKLHTLVNKQLIIEVSDLLSNDTKNGLPVAVSDVIDITIKNFNENNNNKGKITTGKADYNSATGQIIYTPPETFPDAEGSDPQVHFIDEFRYVITVMDDDGSTIKDGANVKIDVFDRPIPENIEIKVVEDFTKTLKLVDKASGLVGTESFTTEIIPVKPVTITSIDIPNIEENYPNDSLPLPKIFAPNDELSIPITPDVEVPSEGEVIIQGTITYTYDPLGDAEGAGAAEPYTSNVKIKVVPPWD